MKWPQIVVIILLILAVVMAFVLHGEPQEPMNGIAMIVSTAIWGGLLYFGGFFKKHG